MAPLLHKDDLVVITGAAGFIASYFAAYLNRHGFTNLVLADDFTRESKQQNFSHLLYKALVHRNDLHQWLNEHAGEVKFVFHLGARTDTTEMDYSIHEALNVTYSQKIWQFCATHSVPLIYASSAATYGNGEHGYTDSHDLPGQLTPLNPYGVSKNVFDIWALQQPAQPSFWAGLKFFNVFGPNEYHKARMASVIFHAYHQIQKEGFVKLFGSHHPDYIDGGQQRDFVYVADIAQMMYWLAEKQPAPGLYNAGTGNARTFKDLVTAIFTTLNLPVNIQYIDTPPDIRDKYQYFTQANMDKLLLAGYPYMFYSLEEAVEDYVTNYLVMDKYYRPME